MPPKKSRHQNHDEGVSSLLHARTARDIAFRSIKRVLDIAQDAVKNPEARPLFDARCLSLEKFVTDFHNEQKNILSILSGCNQIDDFIARDEDISETMQVMYDEINVIAMNFKSNSTAISTSRDANSRTLVQSLILPKIEIPKFDGNMLSWRSFRDMFKSLVHENNAYSDIERFHYLVSYLSGPALTVVKMVPLTADNYGIAWSALQERYENQRLLATAHVEKLFAFAPLQKESAASLSLFVNTFRENVAAIEALGVTDLAGFFLFYIGSRVIDPMTRRLFEASINQKETPNLEALLEFTAQRCKILENVGNCHLEENNGRSIAGTVTKRIKGEKSGKTSLAATAPTKTEKCAFCEHPHAIYRCFAFRKKPVANRRDFANKNKLCFICLNTGHMSSACPTTFTCRLCSGKHNTLLHKTAETSRTCTEKPNENIEGASTSSSCNAQFAGTTRTDTTVLLGTVMVRVRDNTGVLRLVRAVLDSGSQVSAITLDCVNRLGLTRSKCRMEITGLSQQPVATIKGQIQCSFFPTQSDAPEFKAHNVIVLPHIMSATPNDVLPSEIRERYRHLVLADPEFDRPAPVDMLIGGDLYPFVIQSKADIIHTAGFPSAMSTNLGWVIIGALQEGSERPLTSLSVSATPPIEEIMQNFWAIEEPSELSIPTTQDMQGEEWFARTVTRDSTGRFYVGLPFRTVVCPEVSPDHEKIPVVLGSSKNQALNRLYNLERRLTKDPGLYDAYKKFMDDYISLGHMKVAARPGKYFVPHHPVVKRDAKGLKIRVVFDASAPSSSGASLNDCLITGPKLQTEIGDVLLRNRLQKFVFTADITKMYRQIRIHEPDRVYQHILWRNSPSEEVKEYELCTVTYGVNSAPFLAIRCLRELDKEEGLAFPLAKNILVDDTYVDDIFVGADSVEEILEIQRQVIGLLRRGGFSLKKWASNCPDVLTNIAKEDRAATTWIDESKEQTIKVLGVHWDTVQDIFGYHSSIEDVNPTKRSVLSTVARLYDPVGVLGPMIFWAKCLMQRLWMEKLDWDTPLPPELASMWLSFVSKLSDLPYLTLPRHISVNESQEIQLVGFADASQLGYAATVFLRVVDSQRVAKMFFVACKTKVAPLKSSANDLSLTIPRLELCAALLLSRLLYQRLQVLKDKINIVRVRAWTDSTIVLAWLTAEQKLFKIFVTNRVAKIRNLLPQCEWAHVDTTENPADPASRGLLPDALRSCSLFLHGPKFLYYPDDQRPSVAISNIKPEQLPEYKVPKKCVFIAREDEDFTQRFSSLRRMQRVLAYCLRFADRARQRSIVTGPVSWRECETVLLKLVVYTQNNCFPDLSKQLVSPNLTVSPNTLAQLAPFLDERGVIRVGGRLKHSALSSDAKHPMLLPKSAHLTELIIQHYHQNTLHGGTRLVLSLIQRRFWIVSGRAAIRQVIFKCITCTKYKAVAPHPVMADLPSTRVQSYRPFTNVGMDYGGPFTVKESRRRNARTHKAYLALFICLSTRAVHLEVVCDLTTEAFMAALDRFIARRGIPELIQSDCGTNYVGAARQLKALFRDAAVQNTLQSRVPCRWKFNPPAAPHFGGVWEAAIKSTKLHLKKVIGIQVYTFEELTTLIVRIEGVLNSRPLVAVSNDPNDLCALTPGHFLIGQPIMALPEDNMRNIPSNRLRRWQLMKQAFQSFWTRWTREYLHTLQSRQKWYLPDPNLNVGDMVIVNSPSQPPLAWQLGRVVEVHPGSDSVVRVATVNTAEGRLTRPVVKLVKLPID